MKDAKGHGSDARGGAMARLAAAHQNPNHPLGVLHRVVAEGVARSGAIAGQDAKAATELARGNPKAAAAPLHPGMSGPDRLSAYIGDRLPSGGHALTDWHGKQIGTANVKSSWATPRSYVGSRMYSYEAQHQGGTYTGRGFGKGMSINLKKRSK